jgi:hypothetical protein
VIGLALMINREGAKNAKNAEKMLLIKPPIAQVQVAPINPCF